MLPKLSAAPTDSPACDLWGNGSSQAKREEKRDTLGNRITKAEKDVTQTATRSRDRERGRVLSESSRENVV